MIPFQLSPVETWKSVRKAMPKFSKVACRLMPSHGFSSLQTESREEVAGPLHGPLHGPLGSLQSPTTLRGACGRRSAMDGELGLREVARKLGLRLR